MAYTTKSHLESFAEKLLNNYKKTYDEIKDEIANSPSDSVKVDNDTITINDEGVISSKQYTLPTASNNELGGVKIDGITITIDSDGVISASAESVDVATTDKAGIVKPDGTSITVDLDGTIHATTDTNQIKQNIEDYMTKHPVSAEVGDKSVTETKLSDDVLTAIKAKKVMRADTVADIKDLPLYDGAVVKTLGFNIAGDGGGSFYKINKNNDSKNLLMLNNRRIVNNNGATVETFSDGLIVLNGTFTKAIGVEFAPFGQNPLFLANTSYTLSSEYVSGTLSDALDITLYTKTIDKSKGIPYGIRYNSGNYSSSLKSVVTPTYDTMFFSLKFFFPGNSAQTVVCDNYTIKLQFEEGDTPTKWKNAEFKPDGHACLEVGDEYFAELIVEDYKINMNQLGYFSNHPEIDCHDSISSYLRLCQRDEAKYTLFFPTGKWYFSETDIQNERKGVKLEGVIEQVGTDNREGESAIMPFNDNQEYLWNIGKGLNTKDMVAGNSIKNFVFSTGGKFCKVGLVLSYCCYSTFDGLYWHSFQGTGLRLAQGWENRFGYLNMRGVGYITKEKTYDAIEFRKHPTAGGMPSGLSANFFDYINFEGISGSCMWAEQGCNFCHSEIRNIQIEWKHTEEKESDLDVTYTDGLDGMSWDDTSDNIEHVYLLKGNCGTGNTPIVIDTITMSSANKCYYTIKWTDDEGIEHTRYKTRMGIFGENEGYKANNTHGIAVVVSTLRTTTNLDLYHSAYGNKNGTSIKVINGGGTYQPPKIKVWSSRGMIQVEDEFQEYRMTKDGYKIYYPTEINTYKDFDSNSPCLVGYVPNAKSLLSSPQKHGSSYYYINTKNDIKIRLYADYDSVDDLPSSIKPLSYIINNKGQSIGVTTIELKKDDFMSGKYPLKEWFDYTIPTYNLPIGNFLLRIALHINSKLYIDYLAVSEVDKAYKGEYLLSNLTKALKYSNVGEAVWCKDRRNSDAIDYNGVSLRFDGEQFRTFDGRTISELPLAKYTITSNLTNCTGTNSNTSALLNTRYTTTISAASGYSLTDADIICTMSGNPVTVTNGKINISKVTGDIIITATAKQIFNVTNNLTNCVSSNTDATVIEGSTYNATITAGDGYTLGDVTCTMGSVDQTVTGGVINISSVTGDIVITATATPSQP